jgi:hypothetical protein
MSNLYRGPSIDASYQVSVYLAKRLQEKIFRNQSETAAMFVNETRRNEHHPYMLPTKFRFIWPSGFRGEEF